MRLIIPQKPPGPILARVLLILKARCDRTVALDEAADVAHREVRRVGEGEPVAA
jgi:hypothetical protein